MRAWCNPPLLLAALATCSKAPSNPTPPAATSADTSTPAQPLDAVEVLADARELADELGVPEKKRSSLLTRLEKLLTKGSHQPRIYEKIRNKGVSAVVAYRISEGGAVFAAKGGQLLVRLGDVTHRFKVRGWAIGARVDATREWGVGVILGTVAAEGVAGKYEGMRESVAIVAGAGRAELTAREGGHELVLLGRSSGATFGAGSSALTLKPE